MESSILFSPETDERALDREVSKIDQELDSAGTITPEIDESSIGTVEMDGVANGVGDGGGAGMGPGATAGAAGLASKLPKPVAGVSVASAVPVALGGAIGSKMLGAMHSSSARMQTSTTLLGQAWNTFWRPIGDKVDQLFIRDIATDILSETRNFEETLRGGEWAKAFAELSLGIDFDETTFAETVGAVLGSSISGGPIGARIWSGVSQDIADQFGGWPNLLDLWKAGGGWPAIKELWPGWPDLSGFNSVVGASNDALGDFVKWLNGFPGVDINIPTDDTNNNNNNNNNNHEADPGGGHGGGNPGGGGGAMPFAQGGVVRRPTRAVVGESGPEAVLPLDSFLRDLESTIRSSMQSGNRGGGGGGQELRNVERKLDDVNRNLKRLRRDLSDLSLNVDGETFGRASFNGRQNRVTDSDATVL